VILIVLVSPINWDILGLDVCRNTQRNVPNLDVIELLGCHSCHGFYGNECDCTEKCDSGGCNSTCLELVITMMLVSLVKPAWNIAPIIAKRYFVWEMSLVYHIKNDYYGVMCQCKGNPIENISGIPPGSQWNRLGSHWKSGIPVKFHFRDKNRFAVILPKWGSET
jgi:hypothetical protein